MRTKSTRQGKHKEEKTLFGAYVAPEAKALAILTSDILGITFTDIILNGLTSEATRAGIITSGRINKKYADVFEATLEVVKTKIKTKKEKSNA